MEIDWQLYKKAEDDLKALEDEFKKDFFGSKENKNYFHEVKAEVEFTPTELHIQTPYNFYRFNKKLDNTFVFKKNKVEHYVYDIDGKYSFENWKKLIDEAEKDFQEVLDISEDVIAWLDKRTKKSVKQNVSKLFGAWFGKKEEQATIEYKETEIAQETNKQTQEATKEVESETSNEKPNESQVKEEPKEDSGKIQ